MRTTVEFKQIKHVIGALMLAAWVVGLTVSSNSKTKGETSKWNCLCRRASFDQQLGNQDSNLLKGSSSDYPEVTVERFNPLPE